MSDESEPLMASEVSSDAKLDIMRWAKRVEGAAFTHRVGAPWFDATRPYRTVRIVNFAKGHRLMRWARTHWEDTDDSGRKSWLRAAVQHVMAHELAISSRPDDISGVVQYLYSEAVLSPAPEPPCWTDPRNDAEASHIWMGMKNGVVDVTEWAAGNAVLVPHSPRWLSMSCLPFEFQPDANCPKWEAALNLWHESDVETINLLQEFMGVAMTGRACEPIIIVLDGPGENGKTQFLSTLDAMFTDANVSHVPLEKMGDRFGCNQMLGKLLNVSHETNAAAKFDWGRIKALCEGKPQEFEEKYRPVITAPMTARIIVACNERPRILDDPTWGFWRKLKVIPHRVPIRSALRPDQVVADYYLELAKESPGIFNWAVRGLARYWSQRKQFTAPTRVHAATFDWRSSADPLLSMLAEDFEIKTGAEFVVSDLKNAVKQWAETMNRPTPVSEELDSAVSRWSNGRVSRVRARSSSGHRIDVYRGLRRKQLLDPSHAHT